MAQFKTDKEKLDDQRNFLLIDNELLEQQQKAIEQQQKAIVEQKKAIVEQIQNNKVLIEKFRVLLKMQTSDLSKQNDTKAEIETREKAINEIEVEAEAEERFFSSHSDLEDDQENENKKSKKKCKRKVRVRDSLPLDPNKFDEDDDYDDNRDGNRAGRKMKQKQNKNAASSVTSSMFGALPEKLVNKLMDTSVYVKSNLESHSEKKVILETLKTRVNETLTYVEKKCDVANDGEIDYEQQETITDLISDLRKLETEVILKLNIIDEIRLQNSLQPKHVYPIFTGIPSSFLTWSKEIDAMTENMPESQRITIYKKQIQGKMKDEILKLIDTEVNYDALKRLMAAKFGKLATMLPSLENEIRNLKTPDNANDETENIYQMLNFFKILSAHGKLSDCSVGMLHTMKNKLRMFRTEYLDVNFPASPEMFQRQIEKFLNANFRNNLMDGNIDQKLHEITDITVPEITVPPDIENIDAVSPVEACDSDSSSKM